MNLSTAWGLFHGLLISLQDHMLHRLKLKTSTIKRLPKTLGPHHVGCFDLMTRYSPEGVFLRLFYPTNSQELSTNQEVKWLPDEKYVEGLGYFVRIWPRFFRFLYRIVVGDVYAQVAWKARPLRNQGGWPLIVFSHGLGGCRTAYSTLCTEVASQGFVVAVTEHRDQTACMSYYLSDEGDSRKTWIPYRRLLKDEKQYPFRNGQVHHRARECIEALDLMLKLNRGEVVNNVLDTQFSSSIFSNLIDANRVGLMGHSFGGATIVPTMAQDQRFRVGVALDAWMYPVRLEPADNVTQPLLFVNMEKFQTPVNVSSMKRFVSGSVTREIITLIGGVHQNVSDVAFLSDNARLKELFLSNSVLEPHLAMQLICACAARFLWTHLSVQGDEEYLKKLDQHRDLLSSETLSITSKY